MITAGDRIGPLFVERRIGAGGMGEVYLARDERLERLVAIKLLPTASSMDPGAHARMLREARSLSVLKHPGIVTVHDIGVHDGSSYIVMEYVEGETFDELIKRRGKLPPEEALTIIAQVGDAVAAAHAAGVLHRDLKSANLMIERGGGVKVLDFGLAKRTETGSFVRQSLARSSAPAIRASTDVGSAPTAFPPSSGDVSSDAIMPTTPAPSTDVSRDKTRPASSQSGTNGSATGDPQTVHGAGMGTPGWAPPELFDGLPADERSDVFSLGCVFYHLITGTPPFAGATWGTQSERIAAGARPPSATTGVPPAFDRVLASVLDPNPDQRPASVGALVAALREAATPARPHRTINKVLVLGGLAALGIGGVVIIARAMSSNSTAQQPRKPVVAPPPPVKLTSTGGCAYSPTLLDDNTVVYDLTKDGAVDLYRLSLAPGSQPVRLTSDLGWEWRSAAGATANEVVFMVQAKNVGAIETLDIVTGSRHRLAGQSGPVVHAGDAYYYAPAGSGLRRIRNGTDEMFLAMPPNRPVDTIAVSPDGKRVGLLVFDRNRLPELCTVEIAQPKLVCVEVSASSARPAFSSTGNAVYYEALGEPGIMRIAVAGGRSVEVLNANNSAVGGIAVSPSGRTLVYSACTARTELTSVLDGKLAPLVNDEAAAAPIVGPDGVVVFVRGGRLDPALVVRTRDGKLREHYARKGAVLSDVAIAADGDTVAFVVAEDTAPGIYLTRLSNMSTPNRITEDAKDSRPLFVGDRILFTRSDADGTPRLMQVALDGSGAESVSTRPRRTIAAGGGRTLVASPDAQSFYWWDAKTRHEVPALAPPNDEPPTHVSMSPDGRWILYVAGSNGQELWRVHSDGSSKLELINELPGDRNALEGAIDNDGHALITMYTWAGELWIVPPRDGLIW